MAESVTGNAISSAVPQSASLSQVRDAAVTLNFGILASIEGRTVGFGTKATVPGTYGAFTGTPQYYGLIDGQTVVIRNHPSGGYDVTWQQSIVALLLSGMTSGEHLWAALFDVNPPISGSVPVLVLDLGVLNA